MKRQQLFHSFLPSLTLVVLTTQPAWANNIKLDSFQPQSDSDTLSSNDFGILQSTKVFTKIALSESTRAKQSEFIQKNQSKFDFLNNGTFQKTELEFINLGRITTINNVEVGDVKISAAVENQRNESFGLAFIQDYPSDRQTIRTKDSPMVRNKISSLPILSSQVIDAPVCNKENCSKQFSSVNSSESVVIGSSSTNNHRKLQNQTNSFSSVNLLSRTTKANKLLVNHSHSNGAVNLKTGTSNIEKQTLAQKKKKSFAKRLRNLDSPSGKYKKKYRISQSNSPEVTTPTVNPGRNDTKPPNSLNPSPNDLQYPTKPREVRVKGKQPITLAQALELARKNNREFQVSLIQLERSRSALREARAAWYPRVDLSTQLSRGQTAGEQLTNELAQEAGTATSSSDSPTTSATGNAQLTYDIYTSGARRASVKRASEQVRINELDVERLAEEIRLNVSTEYYNLQQADEEVRITQSAVNNAQASLRDAEALERAGVGTRFDVLRSQVNLANAVQDLTNAKSNQEVARRQLANRLSLSESADISAADKVKLAGLWNKSLEESIILAYQSRPELRQQLAQRNINEQTRKEALAQLGPQVSFIASYELLDQFDDSIGITDGYSVALRANLNLFDGGAAKARAAQAKADIKIAETQFAQQRNQIRFQVEDAFSNLQSNQKNVRTAEAALGQAEESLRLARLRFQAGVGTQTDVIAAESELTRAQGNRITAILDYNRALASLQRAVTTRGLR
ncbi:MAG: TolC family protein [Mastigocoleus sp.]